MPERQTHDYQRHGTTILFAALNVLKGTVIGQCQPRHRHQEFLRFLNRIDHSVEAKLDIHLVLDNYGTPKHPAVKKWLTERPRYHVHFTPTSSSWLNQVERWLACALAQKACRDGFCALHKRMAELFRDLAVARADGSIGQLLLKLSRIDVLLLDDFAMAPPERQ